MLNAQRRFYTNLEKVFGRDVHFVAGHVAFGKKFSPGPGFFQDVTMEPGFFQVENTRRLRVFSERIATLVLQPAPAGVLPLPFSGLTWE